jgi:hypothetical protein
MCLWTFRGGELKPHTGDEVILSFLSAIADVCKACQEANLERIKNPRLATRRPDKGGALNYC